MSADLRDAVTALRAVLDRILRGEHVSPSVLDYAVVTVDNAMRRCERGPVVEGRSRTRLIAADEPEPGYLDQHRVADEMWQHP